MSDPTPEQLALADGALEIAAMFGLGGPLWSVARRTGNGITGPAAPATIGTWPGYVKATGQRIATTLAGHDALATGHDAIGPSAAIELTAEAEALGLVDQLLVGDTLTSVATPALRFTVKADQHKIAHARYTLEVA